MSIELRERAIKTANRYLEIQRLEVCHRQYAHRETGRKGSPAC